MLRKKQNICGKYKLKVIISCVVATLSILFFGFVLKCKCSFSSRMKSMSISASLTITKADFSPSPHPLKYTCLSSVTPLGPRRGSSPWSRLPPMWRLISHNAASLQGAQLLTPLPLTHALPSHPHPHRLPPPAPGLADRQGAWPARANLCAELNLHKYRLFSPLWYWERREHACKTPLMCEVKSNDCGRVKSQMFAKGTSHRGWSCKQHDTPFCCYYYWINIKSI